MGYRVSEEDASLYRNAGFWGNETLSTLFRENVKKNPEALALCDMPGKEVVQVYIQHKDRAHASVPRIELAAFEVVDLAPGASETLHFDLSPDRLGYYDTDGQFVTPEAGEAIVSIGGGQPGAHAEVAFKSATVRFKPAG